MLVEPRAKPLVLRPFDKLRVVPSLVERRQAQDERVHQSISGTLRYRLGAAVAGAANVGGSGQLPAYGGQLGTGASGGG